MAYQGTVHKYGDNINTDEIIPAVYLVTTNAEELGQNCMKGIDQEFAARVIKGDVIVAGKNFGCGSSREHAPLAIKGAGVSCVIAESFARIFFRNAINIGLPILESARASRALVAGDRVEVDVTAGTVRRLSDGTIYPVQPFPAFMKELVDAGGLMNWVKQTTA